MIYALAIIAGILNAIMDDRRDYFPFDLTSMLGGWFKRQPDSRWTISWYNRFWLTDRMIEWVNDVWHLAKLLMLNILFIIGVYLESYVEATICLILFGVAFDLVYHRRWKWLTGKLTKGVELDDIEVVVNEGERVD